MSNVSWTAIFFELHYEMKPHFFFCMLIPASAVHVHGCETICRSMGNIPAALFSINNESLSLMPITPYCGVRLGDHVTHQCKDLDWLVLVDDRSHLIF